jgi:enamine deaminase RidA (YjgF/YER057c/UK114 family)
MVETARRQRHLLLPERVPYALLVISERLLELGITLPAVFPPAGNYLGCVIDDDLVYVGGHGPIDGAHVIHGKVGGDLSLEDGYQAARLTSLSILATLQHQLGDLDRIARIVKVFGMVNVAPGFNQTPAVIDGCSDLLLEVFGEAGRHTRSAVGVAELPFDIAVEIELIARLKAA